MTEVNISKKRWIKIAVLETTEDDRIHLIEIKYDFEPRVPDFPWSRLLPDHHEEIYNDLKKRCE